MQVRRARPTDVAQLLELIRQHAAFERATASVREEDLAAILNAPRPPTRLFVAEEQRCLIGYAAVSFDYALWSAGSFAHLDCLFVHETARGHRIGQHLFEQVCLLAAEAGAQRLEWQTPAWNIGAIRFYKRAGGIGRLKMRFSRDLPP